MTYEVAARAHALATKRRQQADQQSDAETLERGPPMTPTIREVLENARKRYLEDYEEVQAQIAEIEARLKSLREFRMKTLTSLSEVEDELERHPAYDTMPADQYQLGFASFV